MAGQREALRRRRARAGRVTAMSSWIAGALAGLLLGGTLPAQVRRSAGAGGARTAAADGSALPLRRRPLVCAAPRSRAVARLSMAVRAPGPPLAATRACCCPPQMIAARGLLAHRPGQGPDRAPPGLGVDGRARSPRTTASSASVRSCSTRPASCPRSGARLFYRRLPVPGSEVVRASGPRGRGHPARRGAAADRPARAGDARGLGPPSRSAVRRHRPGERRGAGRAGARSRALRLGQLVGGAALAAAAPAASGRHVARRVQRRDYRAAGGARRAVHRRSLRPPRRGLRWPGRCPTGASTPRWSRASTAACGSLTPAPASCSDLRDPARDGSGVSLASRDATAGASAATRAGTCASARGRRRWAAAIGSSWSEGGARWSSGSAARAIPFEELCRRRAGPGCAASPTDGSAARAAGRFGRVPLVHRLQPGRLAVRRRRHGGGERIAGLESGHLYPSFGGGVRRLYTIGHYWEAPLLDGAQIAYAPQAGFGLMFSVAAF